MNSDDLKNIDENEASEFTDAALDHYLKHYQLVLKKLVLAQKATKMSFEKLEALSSTKSAEDLQSIWSEIIEVFAECGLSEDELFEIEAVLCNIPKDVKEPYEKLVAKDESIQELIKSIDKSRYEQAMSVIKETQSVPNPLSGLSPEDYEVTEAEAEEGGVVKAFQYSPRQKGKNKD